MAFSKLLTLVFILLSYLYPSAETMLGGIIRSKTLDPKGNPYRIKSDLIVQQNETLILKAGTILLFNNHTGIKVFGTCIIEGTQEKPVILTSINDTTYSLHGEKVKNLFNWNGLHIRKNANEVTITHARILNSRIGIKTEKPDIVLDSCIFSNCYMYTLSLVKQSQDSLITIPDNIPYTFNGEIKAQRIKKPLFTNKYFTRVTEIPKNVYKINPWIKQNKNEIKIAGTYLSGCLFAISTGFAMYHGIKTIDYDTRLYRIEKQFVTSNPDSLRTLHHTLFTKKKSSLTVCILSSISATAFAVSTTLLGTSVFNSTISRTQKLGIEIQPNTPAVSVNFQHYF